MAKNQVEVTEYEVKTKRLCDAEVLDAFPEAKHIIPRKLKEYKQRRAEIVADIKARLKAINEATDDDFSRWFCRKWLMLNEGEELMDTDQHIARLSRQLRLIKGIPSKSVLNESLIQAARDVPIEAFVNQPLRNSGSNLTSLCPFHEERTPSFHIYRRQNRGWCFGCNRGGDAINITMLMHDLGFKEAVLLLTGGQR